MSGWTLATVIAGAVSTLAIFSLLYRENPVYRFFEYLFIGLATGYGLFRAWSDVLYPRWWIPMYQQGQWWWIFPFLIGLLYYTIYIRKLAWMSRLVIGTLMGLGAGASFQAIATQYAPQIAASFRPLLPPNWSPLSAVRGLIRAAAPDFVDRYVPASVPNNLTAAELVNNWIVIIILLSVMTYFFFSFEHRSPVVRGAAKFGRWMLMISFGAVFGQTIMARMALAVSRLWFLLVDPRGLAGPG
ncbi:MAG: hypothetical protein ACP5R4_07420 [Armatimonadota bacterium]